MPYYRRKNNISALLLYTYIYIYVKATRNFTSRPYWGILDIGDPISAICIPPEETTSPEVGYSIKPPTQGAHHVHHLTQGVRRCENKRWQQICN